MVRSLWEGRGPRGKLKERMVSVVGEPEVPVPVASVIVNDGGTQRKVEKDDRQLAPWKSYPHWWHDCYRLRGRADWLMGSYLRKRGGEGVLFMWTPGAWGEPMFVGGHFFPVLTDGLVGGCSRWQISGDTDWWNWEVV